MPIGAGQELSFPVRKRRRGSGEGTQTEHGVRAHVCARLCTTGRTVLEATVWEAAVPAPALRSAPGMHSGMQMLLTWKSGRNQRVLPIPRCRAARSTTNSFACLEGCLP